MSVQRRSRGRLSSAGPYLAEVTNHLDPSYMGSLEVALIKGISNFHDQQGETYIVRYASPFAGNTSVRFEGNTNDDYRDVQKSYGFWMIPPDVGTVVLVIFIEGDPNQGFWIGCVPDKFQNHMVPGIAASKNVKLSEEQRRKYGTNLLPVAEMHKKTRDGSNPNIDATLKPVHPFADRLVQQGLLLDTIRGVTSSSARREVPSQVFGISTPGPLDTKAGYKKGTIGYQESKIDVPIGRLGGTQFVMDDGDANGENELVRIRTRTGHQILLHNSQDLIYIANSRGSAWVELTSNGKIDIYANDSVSIHSEQDFNFRADRDINLEAGRNMHVFVNKNMETNVGGFYNLLVDNYAKIAVAKELHTTVGDNYFLTVSDNANILVSKNLRLSSAGGMDLATTGDMKQGASGSFNVSASGQYIETASAIHMNGPAAATPAVASAASVPPQLPRYSLPNRKVQTGWANGNFYNGGTLSSIMQRVPTHEPWPQHENVNPQQFSPEATDVTLQKRPGLETSPIIPPETPSTSTATNQASANTPEVVPGVCKKEYAVLINAPSAQPGIAALKEAAKKVGLNTPYAVASLLGICGIESAFVPKDEYYNYSPERLKQIFSGATPAIIEKYSYASKKGMSKTEFFSFFYGPTFRGKGFLGNLTDEDGGKFYGRGLIQLTGRANYDFYSKELFKKQLVPTNTFFVDDPNKVNEMNYSALIAAQFLVSRVNVNQNDPSYVETAIKRVGHCVPDIYAGKKGLYECFLAQLQGKTVSTSGSGILTSSDGTPVRTGSGD